MWIKAWVYRVYSDIVRSARIEGKRVNAKDVMRVFRDRVAYDPEPLSPLEWLQTLACEINVGTGWTEDTRGRPCLTSASRPTRTPHEPALPPQPLLYADCAMGVSDLTDDERQTLLRKCSAVRKQSNQTARRLEWVLRDYRVFGDLEYGRVPLQLVPYMRRADGSWRTLEELRELTYHAIVLNGESLQLPYGRTSNPHFFSLGVFDVEPMTEQDIAQAHRDFYSGEQRNSQAERDFDGDLSRWRASARLQRQSVADAVQRLRGEAPPRRSGAARARPGHMATQFLPFYVRNVHCAGNVVRPRMVAFPSQGSVGETYLTYLFRVYFAEWLYSQGRVLVRDLWAGLFESEEEVVEAFRASRDELRALLRGAPKRIVRSYRRRWREQRALYVERVRARNAMRRMRAEAAEPAARCDEEPGDGLPAQVRQSDPETVALVLSGDMLSQGGFSAWLCEAMLRVRESGLQKQNLYAREMHLVLWYARVVGVQTRRRLCEDMGFTQHNVEGLHPECADSHAAAMRILSRGGRHPFHVTPRAEEAEGEPMPAGTAAVGSAAGAVAYDLRQHILPCVKDLDEERVAPLPGPPDPPEPLVYAAGPPWRRALLSAARLLPVGSTVRTVSARGSQRLRNTFMRSQGHPVGRVSTGGALNTLFCDTRREELLRAYRCIHRNGSLRAFFAMERESATRLARLSRLAARGESAVPAEVCAAAVHGADRLLPPECADLRNLCIFGCSTAPQASQPPTAGSAYAPRHEPARRLMPEVLSAPHLVAGVPFVTQYALTADTPTPGFAYPDARGFYELTMRARVRFLHRVAQLRGGGARAEDAYAYPDGLQDLEVAPVVESYWDAFREPSRVRWWPGRPHPQWTPDQVCAFARGGVRVPVCRARCPPFLVGEGQGMYDVSVVPARAATGGAFAAVLVRAPSHNMFMRALGADNDDALAESACLDRYRQLGRALRPPLMVDEFPLRAAYEMPHCRGAASLQARVDASLLRMARARDAADAARERAADELWRSCGLRGDGDRRLVAVATMLPDADPDKARAVTGAQCADVAGMMRQYRARLAYRLWPVNAGGERDRPHEIPIQAFTADRLPASTVVTARPTKRRRQAQNAR